MLPEHGSIERAGPCFSPHPASLSLPSLSSSPPHISRDPLHTHMDSSTHYPVSFTALHLQAPKSPEKYLKRAPGSAHQRSYSRSCLQAWPPTCCGSAALVDPGPLASLTAPPPTPIYDHPHHPASKSGASSASDSGFLMGLQFSSPGPSTLRKAVRSPSPQSSPA